MRMSAPHRTPLLTAAMLAGLALVGSAHADDASSAQYRLSGAFTTGFQTANNDMRSAQYTLVSALGEAFSGLEAPSSTHYRVQSGHTAGPATPDPAPTPELTIERLVPGNGTLTVFFNGSAFPEGTQFTFTCQPPAPDAPLSVTGTASPITLSGLVNGTQYTCTLSTGDSVSPGTPGTPTDELRPIPIPTLSGIAMTLMALLLALIGSTYGNRPLRGPVRPQG